MNLQARMQRTALRRQRLVAECRWQRAELMTHLEPLEHAASSVQSGWNIVNRVLRHPGWIAAIGAGLFLVRPVRLSRLMRAGTNGLRLYRQVAPLLRQIGGPR
jgi:hypothetical protein